MFGFVVEEKYAECFIDAGGLHGVLYVSFAFGEEREDGLEELLLFVWIVLCGLFWLCGWWW